MNAPFAEDPSLGDAWVTLTSGGYIGSMTREMIVLGRADGTGGLAWAKKPRAARDCPASTASFSLLSGERWSAFRKAVVDAASLPEPGPVGGGDGWAVSYAHHGRVGGATKKGESFRFELRGRDTEHQRLAHAFDGLLDPAQ